MFVARKFGMGFFGVKFWFRDYLGVLFEGQGSFSGYDFSPIRLSPSLEIRIRPPPPPSLGQKVTNFSTHTSALSHWQGLT